MHALYFVSRWCLPQQAKQTVSLLAYYFFSVSKTVSSHGLRAGQLQPTSSSSRAFLPPSQDDPKNQLLPGFRNHSPTTVVTHGRQSLAIQSNPIQSTQPNVDSMDIYLIMDSMIHMGFNKALTFSLVLDRLLLLLLTALVAFSLDCWVKLSKIRA